MSIERTELLIEQYATVRLRPAGRKLKHGETHAQKDGSSQQHWRKIERAHTYRTPNDASWIGASLALAAILLSAPPNAAAATSITMNGAQAETLARVLSSYAGWSRAGVDASSRTRVSFEVRGQGAVVSVVDENGKASQFAYDTKTQSISADSSQLSTADTIQMTGPQAKVITTAFAAWASKAVFVPGNNESRDFIPKHYTVTEFEVQTNGKTQYIVSLVPLNFPNGSRGCPPGRNYEVKPASSGQ